mgnify:CR=1 FL=1
MIEQSLAGAVKTMDRDAAESQGLYVSIGKEIDDAYMDELKKQVIHPEIIKEVAPEVSMHCFRMVGGAKQKNLVFDLMVPYDSEKTNQGLKKEIDAQLAARNKKYGTIIRFDGKE